MHVDMEHRIRGGGKCQMVTLALGAVRLALHDDRAYIPSGAPPDDLLNN